MGKTNRRYPDDFRNQAIELVRTSGKSVAAIAKDLGISDATLGDWLRKAGGINGHGRPGELTGAEQEELRRLRRENKILREEREMLKRAAAFFAKENETR